jgi:hypothetical protein
MLYGQSSRRLRACRFNASHLEGNETMALRRLAKDATSGNGGCPAVYTDDADLASMVAQGHPADAATAAELIEVSPGETAVRVPAETVIRAARAYLAEHPELGTL